MLNRRRPVPSIASTHPSTTRKPAPSPSPRTVSSPIPSPPSSATKALPLPPPRLASADHVGSLQAQLDDLALRRGNLQRALRDLQARQRGVGANPLVADIAARRRLEARASALEDGIAEVASEEHDVGLRLHRAWRRKADGGELGATLWVRRVTG